MPDALRLFLVEDEPDVAFLIRRTLERAGHIVACCRSAADALIVLTHSPFDLVLLDQQLPDMTGMELLQTLGREGITLPTLMVTAHGDQELAARVLRAGVLDYVVKDLDCDFLIDLPKRVTESVTRHRLQQTNRLLIGALESARDGIMITDLQGTIIHVNQALLDMTGYAREELLGQNPRILKSSVHARELYADLWHRILDRSSWQGEMTNRRKDGSLFQISLMVSPILDSQGQMTHFVGIQRDITERKQLERQLLQAQKMQSVGTLAGGVAHEFNNLLAGINGYASLGLREDGFTDTLREFLQNVVDLSERAAVLTRQLLAFARKPALSREPTAIAQLVRSTADLVTRTLRTPVELDLLERTAEGEPLLVEADGNQLQQAIVNLALNARDATAVRADSCNGAAEETSSAAPVGFRLGHVRFSEIQPRFPQNVPPGDYVRLEVADHGCGMTAEVLNQALDPFFTTKGVGQGTGLGLPMVFGIVQGHQGYLTIDSEAGRGTTVALYLPRLAAMKMPTRAQPFLQAGEELDPEAVPGRSIVVVDDEEAVLDIVRRFLEIAGHEVRCYTRAREALDHMQNGQGTDLVILDLMMPHEDAQSTFASLRQRYPQMPVLLCTGHPQEEIARTFLEAGQVQLLHKPFRMNELWYSVKQLLSPEDTNE